ncbi:MAG: M3 family metallopeptidase, partial [Bacteroidota bacterium]
EIDSIVKNPAPANFENTILAFDKSGKLLTKVSNVFFNMTGCITNEKMQTIEMQLSSLTSKHFDNISMNEKLFNRIKAVYDKRNEMKLDSQQLRVVEKYYRDFVRNGANLPKDKQEQLKKINEELANLTVKFSKNQLAEINKNFKLVIDKKEDLKGLPQGSIDEAAAAAKENKMEGKWVFTPAKPSMIPFLQYAENRELREKLYRGYFMRGNNNNEFDNKKLITKMTNLRIQKAHLLGFPSYAAYVIDDNMSKTTANVDEFLMKLWKASLPVAKKEAAEMQKIIDKEGGKFKLQSWDWWYYSEKVKKAKYDLDENEIKPYLKMENVRDGMFSVANKLYGITFTKIKDIPVYFPGIDVFEVKEADGKHLSVLYLDYYPRESKKGGAWCTTFRAAGWENGKKVDPIISIVCNFTKPNGDVPSLLTWDETETLFHEFGHALHFMFSEGKYTRTAGNVPQDYVEMPSQFMENWASEPVVLKSFAKHYKTGEVMPDKLIQKITNSGHFNQGFATVEYIAASILDLDYHELTDTANLDIEKFEKTAMDKIGLIPEILPRYRSTYFSHIWDGGYCAGYYVYLWSAVLDADAFNAFKTSKGEIFNKELAAKFRKYCLKESGDDEGMIQYKKFRGQDPSIDPLLEKRGLK